MNRRRARVRTARAVLRRILTKILLQLKIQEVRRPADLRRTAAKAAEAVVLTAAEAAVPAEAAGAAVLKAAEAAVPAEAAGAAVLTAAAEAPVATPAAAGPAEAAQAVPAAIQESLMISRVSKYY